MGAECCPDPRLPRPLPRAPPFALATPSHLIPSAAIPSPRLCSHPEPEGKWTGSRRKCWGNPSVLANLFPAVEGFPGLNGRKRWDGTPHPGRAVEASRTGVPYSTSLPLLDTSCFGSLLRPSTA